MVNQTQPSIEHIVLERRLSQISGSQISGNGISGNGNGDFGPETNDTKFSRSPRSSSIRRRSEMPNPGVPVVVNVPMPQLQVHKFSKDVFRYGRITWFCLLLTVHRGAFCQFPFQWIYYYDSNKSTGKETGKSTSVQWLKQLKVRKSWKQIMVTPIYSRSS